MCTVHTRGKQAGNCEWGVIISIRLFRLSVFRSYIPPVLLKLSSVLCVSGMGQHPKDIQPIQHGCEKPCSRRGPVPPHEGFRYLMESMP